MFLPLSGSGSSKPVSAPSPFCFPQLFPLGLQWLRVQVALQAFRGENIFFKRIFYYLNLHLKIDCGAGWFVTLINAGAFQPR